MGASRLFLKLGKMLIVVEGGNISIHFSLLLGMLGKCSLKIFLKE